MTDMQQSDTVIIVLHEIYGINEHLAEVLQQIESYGYAAIAPNFINGRGFSSDQETAAYQYFMSHVGFDEALSQIVAVIKKARTIYNKVYVLGFSVGATLAWLCSETSLCDLCFGFYGSRIRDYMALTPKCPVLLFFPASEKSFVVDGLVQELNKIYNVQAVKLPGCHGFANPCSENYQAESSQEAWAKIKALL